MPPVRRVVIDCAVSECIFCQIVAGRAAAHRLLEDEHTLAFLNIAPATVEDGQTARPGNRKGRTMTEASVSFAGNLTNDPELRHTESGIARAMFRVAVSGRREQEASFFTVIVWRDQAEHAAQSLAKGSRIVVVGRLQ
jgi:hypothetical protein